MASPTVVSRTESATTTDATSHSIARAAGVSGQLSIVIIASDADPTWTVTGYTAFGSVGGAGTGHSVRFYYRQEDGTEGTTISASTGALEKAAFLVYSLSGAENPGTQVPEVEVTTQAASVNPDPPSITPTGGSKDYRFIAGSEQDGEEADDDTWCTAFSSGYSNGIQKTSGTGGAVTTNVSVAAADRAATVSSEDPGTLTFAQSLALRPFTIAIHPAASGDQTLTGSTFTKAGTFPQGAVSATYDLAGSTFTKAGTFPQGAVSFDITGTTFQRAGTFPQGAITATYDLAGSTFTKAGTYPQGTVALEGGDQTLTGATFTKAGTFPQGAITATYDLLGTTFVRAGTYPQGTITPGPVNLAGTTFVRSGTYPQGAVALEGGPQSLTGATFVRAGTFPQGSITSVRDLLGVTFVRSGTFPVGTITPGAVNLAGVTFVRSGTFPIGAITGGGQGAPVRHPQAVWTSSEGQAILARTESQARDSALVGEATE